MKNKFCLFIYFILMCLIFPNFINAAEKVKTCQYEGDYLGSYLYFYNDGSLTGEEYFDGSNLNPSRKMEEYIDDIQSVTDNFSKTNECPTYVVRYRGDWGVVRYKYFYDSNSKDTFVDEHTSKLVGNVYLSRAYWGSLVNSTSNDDLPENNVNDGEELYQKTYESVKSNEFGNVTFSFKYNLDNEYFSQTIMRFTSNGKQPIIIDQSIENFKTNILEKSINEQFPESIYCGTIASYLTVKNNVIIIAGDDEINNGDVVCSFDKNLFNDSTNKLIRFHNNDYGDIDNSENDNNDENQSENDVNDENPDYKVEDTNVESICAMPSYRKPMKFIGTIINFIKIIIPIVIIGFGLMDLYKAVTGSKDDEIKKSIKSIAIRIIAGIFIFLLPGIIQFVLNMVNEWSDYKNSWCCCTDCLLNPDCDVNTCNSNSCKIEGMN